ncbi:MAG: hypothetical protein HOJ35_03580 [Bdellovibrionales bacterium]|nr:hypothetical protein [Bdellovibrionales bacterium]
MTHECPCCLQDFNTEDPKHIPYEICSNGHFLDQGCIMELVQAANRTYSIKTNIEKNTLIIKVTNNGWHDCNSIKCPECRESISPVHDVFKFHRNRHFDKLISNMEPSLAMDERRKVKKSIKKSMTTMESAFGPMIEQFKKLQEDYSSLISTQEESVSQYETDIEKKIEHTAFLKAEIQKLKDEIKVLESKKPLLMSEYKRQAISDGKHQIDQIVNDYRQEIESKLQKEETQMREKHSETVKHLEEKYHDDIEEIETYKLSLRFKKKEILSEFLESESSEVRELKTQKSKLQNTIDILKDECSKVQAERDFALEKAMEKYGFHPEYISQQFKKLEQEAEEIQKHILDTAAQEANEEKRKIKYEVENLRRQVENQLAVWQSNRREFKRFLELKKKLGVEKAELSYSPRDTPIEGQSVETIYIGMESPEMIETSFWKMLKQYEKLENPTYQLKDYIDWTKRGDHHMRTVESFLERQRMLMM